MMQKLRYATESPLYPVLVSFWQWRKLWIGCTAAFAAIGLVYAVALKSDTWVATQGLIVRDEATGTVMRLGRFESQTQMKAAQELVLEIASSPQVVGKALAAVGKPAKFLGLIKGSSTFSPADIESFGRSCVSVRAPRGAELGTTEVIYLEIKQKSKERAVQLAAALCDALESQLQEVRRIRADGVVKELQAAISVSESALQRSTEKLKNIELEAGADLVDLRGLTDSNSGSTNRLMLDMVRDDLRKCEIELQLHRENLEASQLGLENPELLMQITDRLVESQPTIKILREGLSQARLRTAQLQGRFSDSHADVIIAKTTEQRFRDNLLRELASSEQAILGAIELCEKKTAKLNDQERELGKRLNRLADIRADYTNVVSEVKATNEELQRIKRELTQAMAARNAASSSSLITRIDQPLIGDRPVGPGRTTIVGGSLVGGLFFGLGIVFLLTPLNTTGLHDRSGNSASTLQAESQSCPSHNAQEVFEPQSQSPTTESKSHSPTFAVTEVQAPLGETSDHHTLWDEKKLCNSNEFPLRAQIFGQADASDSSPSLASALKDSGASFRTGFASAVANTPPPKPTQARPSQVAASPPQPSAQRQAAPSQVKSKELEELKSIIAKVIESPDTQI